MRSFFRYLVREKIRDDDPSILLDDRKTIVASWEDVIEKDSEDMQ